MTAILSSAPVERRPAAQIAGIRLNWETAAYLIILVLAIFTRFYGLGDRVMSHDESLHTQFSYNLYRDGVFQHTPLMHGPILFHAVAFSYFMFGDNDFSARLYPAILGVIMTVLFPILFRRWLGTWGALLMAVMLLISPIWLFYNRYIREDTPNIFAMFLMIYCFFMYMDGPRHLRRKARWLYLCAVAFLWNMGSKETGFMYVAVVGLFMTIFWLVRLYQHFSGKPSRTLFESIIIGSLIGGTAALIMYAVISISLQPYPTLEDRAAYISQSFANLFGGQPTSIDFNAFITWTLITLAAFVGVLAGTFTYAFRSGRRAPPVRNLLLVVLVALLVCVLFIGVEELSQVPSRAEATTPAVPGEEVVEAVEATTPIRELGVVIGAWVFAGAVVVAIFYMTQRGGWRTIYRFREFDMMLLMGSIILPWCTPVLIKLTGNSATDYSPEGIQRAIVLGLPMLAISAALGLTWNWKRWLIYNVCFYVPFVFFFTTMFTNPQGLATGVIGSLGYWLEQQGVRRGSQPQYYYQMIVMPMYEYLPIIGSIIAMFIGTTHFWNRRRAEMETVAALRERSQPTLGSLLETEAEGEEKAKRDEMLVEPAPLSEADLRLMRREERAALLPFRLNTMSFILFMAWMSVFNLLAFTLAGEKMPWLGTHLTVPMIILTAWYFGGIMERIDFAAFLKRGWLLLILLPLLFIALFQVASPFLLGSASFGLQQEQLQRTLEWVGVIAFAVLIVFLISRVTAFVGGKHLRHMLAAAAFLFLSVLTFRAAWTAAFINYDYANEFLVYAHGAPGFKLMMDQLEDISRRTTNGMDVRFAWGGNAWPASWYFRELNNAVFFGQNPTPQILQDAVAVYASDDIRSRVEPLLEDRYVRIDYTRMWWPMQDYFNLNATRVLNTFDFNPVNVQASEIRRGLFDIWWARDYDRYGQATGGTFSLSAWPVSEGMGFYVRRDVAAQIWNLGVGDATVAAAEDVTAVNACVANWQPSAPDIVFAPPPTGPLNKPTDISIGANELIYVTDEFNNRIVVYNQNGEYVTEFNRASSPTGLFERPNGIAVAPGGELVVADTWNFRVQVIDADGLPILGWGQDARLGSGAPQVPVDGLWGPRDVAVDAEGNIYVSDTGNKRIRVYDENGDYLRDIGSGGFEIGQLDEPSGLALHPDGRLFVADTWNRRVSVFNSSDGTPSYVFDVRGWYDDLGNRPYLALDVLRDYLYVSDPDAGRVLVYSSTGECVGSFGQPGDEPLGAGQFRVTGGLAVDALGRVYVVDSGANRISRFSPFVPPVSSEPQG